MARVATAFTTMKKLLILFVALATALFGADAANDVVLSQRKADNSGFIQRNVVPVAGGFLQFNASKVPVGLTLTTITYSATPDIATTANLQTIALTGDAAFTASGYAAGQYVTVRVVCDGTNRTISFPATWVWVGSVAPTTLIASKVGLLSLVVFGTTEATVVASWASSL